MDLRLNPNSENWGYEGRREAGPYWSPQGFPSTCLVAIHPCGWALGQAWYFAVIQLGKETKAGRTGEKGWMVTWSNLQG